jgi:hypothetical protein
MKDVIIATGPWVGGQLTIPHRMVLVSRHQWKGSGDKFEIEPVPDEFVIYHQQPTGHLHSGDYYPVEPQVWRAQLTALLPRFFQKVANYAAMYADHVLLADPMLEE